MCKTRDTQYEPLLASAARMAEPDEPLEAVSGGGVEFQLPLAMIEGLHSLSDVLSLDTYVCRRRRRCRAFACPRAAEPRARAQLAQRAERAGAGGPARVPAPRHSRGC